MGSRPQETLVGRLGDVVGKARAAGLQPPVVGVIGDVVTLRGRLRWFEDAPAAHERPMLDPLVFSTAGTDHASWPSAAGVA